MKSRLTMMMKAFFGLIAVCFLLTSSSVAKTYYVGTCHASSYSTISAAVAVAPPGSKVEVCPGTYPEQVFITQALTLEGISSATKDRARIIPPIPPAGGPPTWQFVPDPDYASDMVAPQIYVNSPAGAVTIENLTIDASLETTAPACNTSGFWFTTAILLENSGATIKRVNTLGQGKNSGCGIGIWDYVAGAVPTNLSLTNSSLQDAAYIGLYLDGDGLSSSVVNNVLDLTSKEYGIGASGSGTISSNFLNAPAANLVIDGGSVGSITYSDNVVRDTAAGSICMVLLRAAQVTGNKIDGCTNAIVLSDYLADAVSIQNNLIVNTKLGIGLECASAVTLSGNTVNNAAVGVDSPLNPVSATQVTFDNVNKLATGTCPL
jgi:nitrous oxidase accessory protein NosD